MGKFSKRKKNFYVAPNKRPKLDQLVGSAGFLGTCNTHEDVCVREGYSLLNLYADQLYGPEKKTQEPGDEAASKTADDDSAKAEDAADQSSDEEDIEAALKKEVAILQKEKSVKKGGDRHTPRTPRRFQAIPCGASNNVFFKTTLADPLPLLQTAMDDILTSGEQRTRHLIRLLPVHAVCKAYLDNIEKNLDIFIKQRFKGQKKSFYVVVKVMSNSSITKDQVLSVVLKVMETVAPECKPVLTNADVAVVVNVLVTNCYIGEAPLYLDKYKKYNLIELATPADEKKKAAAKNGEKSEAKTDQKEENTEGENDDVKTTADEVKEAAVEELKK